MADIYVRSTDGNDADNGSSWALAKATLVGASAIDAVGDTIYLSQSHAESSTGIINLAGTLASPTRVICGNDEAGPPTTRESTAVVGSTGGIAISGGAYSIEGITLDAGSGSSGSISIVVGSSTGNVSVFRDCVMKLSSTGSASRIDISSAPGAISTWENVDVYFSSTGQGIRLNTTLGFRWSGGSLLTGSASPVTLVLPSTTGSNSIDASISALDLSNASPSINLISAGGPVRSQWLHVRLPAGWSGSFVAGTIVGLRERHEFYNCDSGDTNYRLHVRDYAGTLNSETTLVRSGGASDGDTALSWRVVTSANAKNATPFYTPEIGVWGDTTGANKTLTVEILHDSVTDLTDADVWVDVLYLGTSASTLGSIASDGQANILGSASAQATSAASWTTTGMSSPNKQKLEVTFTPQKKGFYLARVCVAKANYTLYIDPEITVT